eukprot:gb/GECG01002336.1/.p1 GENE.gb/GECG01002336.1/~~gb/GECG01002336.1/.p1  ORF type:complete len:102 (+),score=20.32 gb/GECG01002336.1/:1-306(+)
MEVFIEEQFQTLLEKRQADRDRHEELLSNGSQEALLLNEMAAEEENLETCNILYKVARLVSRKPESGSMRTLFWKCYSTEEKKINFERFLARAQIILSIPA